MADLDCVQTHPDCTTKRDRCRALAYNSGKILPDGTYDTQKADFEARLCDQRCAKSCGVTQMTRAIRRIKASMTGNDKYVAVAAAVVAVAVIGGVVYMVAKKR